MESITLRKITLTLGVEATGENHDTWPLAKEMAALLVEKYGELVMVDVEDVVIVE